MSHFANPLPSQPAANRPATASARLYELLRFETRLSPEVTTKLVQHLAMIEEMEARLGSPGLPPEEFDELVRSCHRLVNEAQQLHLAAHLRRASVAPF